MKTRACQLLAYGETAGAPVCICSFALAMAWQGTDQEQTMYWEVVQSIGKTLLFEFDAQHQFFNTETGNFALFRSADETELVMAEVIYAEENATFPWRGIHFAGTADTRTPVLLKGLTCFFDAALTLPDNLLPRVALYAVGQAKPWNTAVLDCHYDAAYEITFKSDMLHLEGICFRKEGI